MRIQREQLPRQEKLLVNVGTQVEPAPGASTRSVVSNAADQQAVSSVNFANAARKQLTVAASYLHFLSLLPDRQSKVKKWPSIASRRASLRTAESSERRFNCQRGGLLFTISGPRGWGQLPEFVQAPFTLSRPDGLREANAIAFRYGEAAHVTPP